MQENRKEKEQKNSFQNDKENRNDNTYRSQVLANYGDIINLPHHVSKRHPQMPLSDRAAQFGSYAALRGYDTAVKNTVEKSIDQKENEVEKEQYDDENLFMH